MGYRPLQIRECPKCGREYKGRPALSREDSQLLICPDCGTREALASIGVGEAEQDEIIEIIHSHYHFEDGEITGGEDHGDCK